MTEEINKATAKYKRRNFKSICFPYGLQIFKYLWTAMAMRMKAENEAILELPNQYSLQGTDKKLSSCTYGKYCSQAPKQFNVNPNRSTNERNGMK